MSTILSIILLWFAISVPASLIIAAFMSLGRKEAPEALYEQQREFAAVPFGERHSESDRDLA